MKPLTKDDIEIIAGPILPTNIDGLVWKVSDKNKYVVGRICISGADLNQITSARDFYELWQDSMDECLAIMNDWLEKFDPGVNR